MKDNEKYIPNIEGVYQPERIKKIKYNYQEEFIDEHKECCKDKDEKEYKPLEEQIKEAERLYKEKYESDEKNRDELKKEENELE